MTTTKLPLSTWVDAATVKRCIEAIRNLPEAHAPAGEYWIVQLCITTLEKIAPGVDEWALVPLRPTRAMMEAALRSIPDDEGAEWFGSVARAMVESDIGIGCWAAMLFTAPDYRAPDRGD